MTTPPEAHPADPQLSAYLDGELDPAASRQASDHLAACPRCAARLAAMQALSEDFASLPQDGLGFDLAGVIDGRLAAAAARPRPRVAGWYGLLPVAVGAAASVALGIALGAMLFGGGAALPRVAALSVFDAIPPGGLCLGLDACYSKKTDKSGAFK